MNTKTYKTAAALMGALLLICLLGLGLAAQNAYRAAQEAPAGQTALAEADQDEALAPAEGQPVTGEGTSVFQLMPVYAVAGLLCLAALLILGSNRALDVLPSGQEKQNSANPAQEQAVRMAAGMR